MHHGRHDDRPRLRRDDDASALCGGAGCRARGVVPGRAAGPVAHASGVSRAGVLPDPDWTVRDVVAHLGTWLAEAGQQLERMAGGTYAGHDVDIDALNASFLAAMQGQPWEVAWPQASAARTWLLLAWASLPGPDAESAWWIHKAGPEHYEEHLDRLREWTAELIARR